MKNGILFCIPQSVISKDEVMKLSMEEVHKLYIDTISGFMRYYVGSEGLWEQVLNDCFFFNHQDYTYRYFEDYPQELIVEENNAYNVYYNVA